MSIVARAFLGFAILGLVAAPLTGAPAAAINASCQSSNVFGMAMPEEEKLDSKKLLELTNWVRNSAAPILSLSVSRHGRVVYELYSAKADPNAADYVMSVTKSITSALVGAALDRGLIRDTDQSITDLLPAALFTDAARVRFRKVSLKDVMGMSALDAEVPPHLTNPDTIRRLSEFLGSSNRVRFALSQDLLVSPGLDFQYTDVTPLLAGGVVQYATHQTLLDFGAAALFGPMDFHNVEWMHSDAAGIDNAAYGLRLRPIDMQKLGILFLDHGCWGGRQLLSPEWVDLSLTPWIASNHANIDYGWYWWQIVRGPGWLEHQANGWKGQRISIFPEKQLVVTMTAIVEDGSEGRLYTDILRRFVIPAVDGWTPSPQAQNDDSQLKAALRDVWLNKNPITRSTENRMIPSVAPKESHHTFRGR